MFDTYFECIATLYAMTGQNIEFVKGIINSVELSSLPGKLWKLILFTKQYAGRKDFVGKSVEFKPLFP